MILRIILIILKKKKVKYKEDFILIKMIGLSKKLTQK